MRNSKTNTVTHAGAERDVQISSRRSSRHCSLLQHSRVQAISLRLNSHLEGKLELNSPLGGLYPRTSILRTHEGQEGADPLPPQPALVLQPLYLFSLNTYTPLRSLLPLGIRFIIHGNPKFTSPNAYIRTIDSSSSTVSSIGIICTTNSSSSSSCARCGFERCWSAVSASVQCE